MKKLSFLSLIVIFLTNCGPSNPTPILDFKIKDLKIVEAQDSTSYHFTYNSNGKLDRVTQDGYDYAAMVYLSSQVKIIRYGGQFHRYDDTFYLNINSNNLIDTVYSRNQTNRFLRNSNDQLVLARGTKFDSEFYSSATGRSGFNILSYERKMPYSCGILNPFCYETVNDTIVYSAISIQSNLPEQFVGVPTIEDVLGFRDLTPLFLAQQSGFFAYFPHDNLREFWYTHYAFPDYNSYIVGIRFRYEYKKDGLNRVTQIKKYDIQNSNVVPLMIYYISY